MSKTSPMRDADVFARAAADIVPAPAVNQRAELAAGVAVNDPAGSERTRAFDALALCMAESGLGG